MTLAARINGVSTLRIRDCAILGILAVFSASIAPTATIAGEIRLFSIGAGDLSGGYYSAATAICKIFNETDGTPRRCSPEPTAGSIYNLMMLRAGELDFALVQSDWQRAAYLGRGPFEEDGPMVELRGVMPLYPEAITILAAPGSGIATSADLEGKIVDIGSPASGRNATVRALLAGVGLGKDYFGTVKQFESSLAIKELCAGRIDATIFVVGHPSALIAETLGSCDAALVDFVGPRIDRLVGESDDYQKTTISAGMYRELSEDVETLAVVATLVTRASIEPELVADLTAAIRRELGPLSESAVLLRDLKRYIDTPLGMTAPLHEGAAEAVDGKAVVQ